MLQDIELGVAKSEPQSRVQSTQTVGAWLRQSRTVQWGVGLIFPLALLWLWQGSVAKNWVNPLLLPAPELVWTALKDLYSSGELWSNLQVSLTRIAYGFSAGILLAIVLGLTMGL